MKQKLFNVKNLIVTVKSIVVGIVAGLPLILLSLLRTKYPAISMVLMATYMVFYLFLWGYLANKWWRWN